jgi:5-hydroxyisourate hydrolase-like protein (transthyretin family)
MSPIERGRFFEEEVLGWNKWLCEPFASCHPLGFDDAVELVLSKQPDSWDPLNPTTLKGKHLLESIRKVIKEETEGRYLPWVSSRLSSSTGLYVALHTAADYYHQTDAIVCCDLGEVAPIVTIDFKLHDKHKDFPRENHVVITEAHFSGITKGGKPRLEIIAGVIADHLLEQLKDLGWLSSGRQSRAS